MKIAMKDTGLSEEFLDSPKEVMHATLAYLDSQYGGPKTYLERIGASRATQEKIKAILGLSPVPIGEAPSQVRDCCILSLSLYFRTTVAESAPFHFSMRHSATYVISLRCRRRRRASRRPRRRA